MLGRSKWIDLGVELLIAITFKPSYEGRHEETLELTFQDVPRSQQFSITRQIRATVGSVDDQDRLKPKAPYRRHKSVALPLEGRIISPLRPPTWTETKWTVVLPEYKAHSSLIKAAYGHDGRKVVTRNFMPAVFNNKTHGRHFQNMLWIEEEQRRLNSHSNPNTCDLLSHSFYHSRDLLTYAMTAQLVPKHPRYMCVVPSTKKRCLSYRLNLSLEVEGLAEGRPSILVGDFILVKQHGTPTDWYKGCVHEIMMNTVSLRFSSKFSTYKGNTFDVRFVLNRLPLRRMHQALTLETDSTRILFPEPEHISSTPVGIEQLRAINPINRLIGEDHEQLMTVAAIVHQPPGSVPFVIFGPLVVVFFLAVFVDNLFVALEPAKLSQLSKQFASF
jgi:helicase MOV-10